MKAIVESMPAETPPGEGLPDIYDITLLVLRRKWHILGAALLAVAAGMVYASLAEPVYSARAVIIPKGADAKAAGGGEIISQLGLGGMLAGRDKGISSIQRIEMSAVSRMIGERVVEKHGLLPRLFPELWDAAAGRWIDSAGKPLPRDGHGVIMEKMFAMESDAKKNIVTLVVRSSEPQLAFDLVNAYLEELNLKLREDVIRDAENNLKFLEGQFASILDPELRVKLQSLMASEIERSMLVSTNAFEVFEGPILPTGKQWPLPKRILILSLLLGAAVGMSGVIVQALSGRFMTHLRARMAVAGETA